MSYPKVTIRSTDPSKPPHGSNTTLLIDGKPVPTACFVKAEFHSRRVTKVTIEMYAHVDIETEADVKTKVVAATSKA